jgi:hypothetical protein
MPSREPTAVVQAAVNPTRSHPHTPLLDLLDLVMNCCLDQALDFSDSAAVNGSIASAWRAVQSVAGGGVR